MLDFCNVDLTFWLFKITLKGVGVGIQQIENALHKIILKSQIRQNRL